MGTKTTKETHADLATVAKKCLKNLMKSIPWLAQ
jgi:hypothetical protein